MMTIHIQASLQDAIEQWASQESESGVLSDRDAYWPDTLTERMAQAAYNVLMANAEGQEYANEQREE